MALMPEAYREFQQQQHSLRKMDYATLYMPCGLKLRISCVANDLIVGGLALILTFLISMLEKEGN